MKFIKTDFENLFQIELTPFEDERGLFQRLFCKDEASKVGIKKDIVQVNNSRTTKKGSIRGMHYQLSPSAETKIIKCIRGEIFDVAVDLRKDSKTFLKWYGIKLSEEDNKMVIIPEGFSHGFQTLKDDSEILYLTTNYYSKENERGIRYNDPLINIEWPLNPTDISDKDSVHKLLTKDYKGVEL